MQIALVSILAFWLFAGYAFSPVQAQVPDTTKPTVIDSQRVTNAANTVAVVPIKATDTSLQNNNAQIGKLPWRKSQLPQLFLAMMLLGVLALVRYFYGKYVQEVLHHTIQSSAEMRVLKNESIGKILPGVLFDILYFGLATVFILHLFSAYHNKAFLLQPILYAEVLAGLLLMVLLKYAITKIVGWVFNASNVSNTATAYQLMLRHSMVLLLIPLICFLLLVQALPALKIALGLALFIVTALHIYNTLKQVVLARKNTAATFFDILFYLCAVDILPSALFIVWLFRTLAAKS